MTLLGLLDLSTAFDTVDHKILIHRLQISFGFGGVALQWIESFLPGRSSRPMPTSHRITRLKFMSANLSVMYGVPQGSLIGPLLYTADVTYPPPCTTFAFTRTPTTLNSTGPAQLLMVQRSLCNCANRWMCSNRLTSTKHSFRCTSTTAANQLCSVDCQRRSCVTVLRTLSETSVTPLTLSSFKQHVNGVVRRPSCFYQLRQLRPVRRSVPDDAMCTRYMRSSQVALTRV